MSPNLQTNSIGLPDIISTSLNVVFCGINPGMRSAAVGLNFANRSNRFWRVLHLAGFTARQLEPEEARLLLDYGCGITSAVARPTVSAAHLSRADYIAARPVFERKIAKYRPTYLAFLGKPAYSAFLNQRDLSWGLQPTAFGGSAVWVLPNPSGLNRAFTISMLTDAYRELFEAVALRARLATKKQ
jgi:double-stranded uracil-DNA glycosylase